MAHADGWIELYRLLENNLAPTQELVARCKQGKSGIGETMLHWYCIEGSVHVIEKLIGLGFSIDVQNDFGNTPIMEAAVIDRWDVVRLLMKNGADLRIVNGEGNSFFMHIKEYRKKIPGDIRLRYWLTRLTTRK